MIRCAITDQLLRHVDADWVQIRNKEISARELTQLVRQAMSFHAKVIVNTRVDVAVACGAAGAHLPAGSIAPNAFRAITPVGFLIGVSCHTFEEATQAEADGADYVVFGPVFAPLSKSSDLAPRGLEELAKVARAVKIPVLALGGITNENAQACVDSGAAGVAGISLFRN
jgi:thiamine-phosphate pyrophosphorylase